MMAETDAFSKIMDAQYRLQLRTGNNILAMSVAEKVEYIKLNILALEDELHEALHETRWKPWTKGPRAINREAYLQELADCLHFMLNLYLAVNASPAEVIAGYWAKNDVNHARQNAGYTGDKCPVCHRAPDEPHVTA
jgi:dimeric dUTPase (all-alpha-NTP-PPase superfamily)